MVSTTENAEVIVPKRTSPRSRQIDPKRRDQVEALYKAGWQPKQIAGSTGVNRMTIFQWAKRYHWTETRDKVGQLLEKGVAATIAEKLERRSEEVRDQLSKGVVAQADILAEHPPKSFADVAGVKGKRGHAETALTLITASEKLFGWNKQDGPSTLVQINYLADLVPATPQEQPACVDVSSVVQPPASA
jgi:hypothetical protein